LAVVGTGSDWIARIHGAVRGETVLDLAPGVSNDDLGARAEDDWPDSAELTAAELRCALLAAELPVTPFGLVVRGARIVGELDLARARLPIRLSFQHCRFTEGISAEGLACRDLAVTHCTIHGVNLGGASIDGSLQISFTTMIGGLRAEHCTITRRLILAKTTIRASDGRAIELDDAKLRSDVAMHGSNVQGEIRAIGVEIGGQLNLEEAELRNGQRFALVLDQASIRGGAFLNRSTTEGEIRLLGARIDGQLSLNEAELENADGNVLSLDQADIRNGVFLQKAHAQGTIRAFGARIGGQLSLHEATLENPGEIVLLLNGAHISGDASLRKLNARGEIRMIAAEIGGQLSLYQATIANPGNVALCLDHLTIKSGAFLERLTARGEVRALGAKVNNQLDLDNADLDNPEGDALSLDRAIVEGTLFLRRAKARGTVRLVGMRIGSQLSLLGTTLRRPGHTALTLAGATIGHMLVDLPSGPEGTAGMINAQNLTVGWLDVLEGGHESRWDLRRTTVDRFEVRRPEAISLLAIEGWKVGSVHGALIERSGAARRLLDTVPREKGSRHFAGGPWRELADAIERGGRPEIARGLRVSAARRSARAGNRATVPLRLAYGALVGYGYRPWLTLGWLAGLYLATLLLLHFAGPELVATSPAAAATIAAGAEFHPYLYALDLSLPVATTGQSSLWTVIGPTGLLLAFGAIKACSWALIALLLAGITGLLRKPQ